MKSSIKYIFAIAVAWLMCASQAYAQKQKQEAVDPAELSFGENISSPKPASKGLRELQEHMKSIEATFVKHGLAVDITRNGEVVVVTIPCEKLFAANDVQLKPTGRRFLRPFVDFLKVPTMYKLIVAVYSDNTGEPEYTETLTSERANAIEAYLQDEAHVKAKNVVPYGLGQADPKMPNNSYEGRTANRRVEIYIVPEWQMLEMAKSGKLKQN